MYKPCGIELFRYDEDKDLNVASICITDCAAVESFPETLSDERVDKGFYLGLCPDSEA